MAAAKGFAGENATLVEMTFELLQDVKKEDSVTLQITDAELMKDKPQRIEVKSRNSTVYLKKVILPVANLEP